MKKTIEIKYIIILTIVSIFTQSCDDFNTFPSGSISGTITDSVADVGLGDVLITLEPVLAANGSVRSFHDGSFRLDRIVEGNYVLRVKKDGNSIIDNIVDTIVVKNGSAFVFNYKLTPRVSITDFEVMYQPSDSITNFTVKFKGVGNKGNVFNFYSVMWDQYPNKTFAEVAASNKVASRNTALTTEILYEVKDKVLEKGRTYYIRVGASHLTSGGDYNLSKCIPIKFE
ncbi:MAG: carboxypeptidase-like regulatory domain-containing protein [Lentimicrobium sp.]|jgi:hypothetical protein|nr:carboxypeptidase-like regulatory domain-containing protein [Lentimicrobium sp.]